MHVAEEYPYALQHFYMAFVKTVSLTGDGTRSLRPSASSLDVEVEVGMIGSMEMLKS